MKKHRAFTLIELLVVIAIIALLIGILVPALGAAQRQARKLKNATHMRAITNTLVLWSNANTATDDFPGSLTSATGNYPANATDPTVVGRFWALLAASGIDPLPAQMLINPLASGTDLLWSNTASISPGVTTCTQAQFASNNVSYALLDTKMGSEWKNNINSGCPLVCDRSRATTTSSSWSTTSWQGSVGWGDGHAGFENSSNLAVSIYGNSFPANNLWAPATSSNAAMLNPGS